MKIFAMMFYFPFWAAVCALASGGATAAPMPPGYNNMMLHSNAVIVLDAALWEVVETQQLHDSLDWQKYMWDLDAPTFAADYQRIEAARNAGSISKDDFTQLTKLYQDANALAAQGAQDEAAVWRSLNEATALLGKAQDLFLAKNYSGAISAAAAVSNMCAVDSGNAQSLIKVGAFKYVKARAMHKEMLDAFAKALQRRPPPVQPVPYIPYN